LQHRVVGHAAVFHQIAAVHRTDIGSDRVVPVFGSLIPHPDILEAIGIGFYGLPVVVLAGIGADALCTGAAGRNPEEAPGAAVFQSFGAGHPAIAFTADRLSLPAEPERGIRDLVAYEAAFGIGRDGGQVALQSEVRARRRLGQGGIPVDRAGDPFVEVAGAGEGQGRAQPKLDRARDVLGGIHRAVEGHGAQRGLVIGDGVRPVQGHHTGRPVIVPGDGADAAARSALSFDAQLVIAAVKVVGDAHPRGGQRVCRAACDHQRRRDDDGIGVAHKPRGISDLQRGRNGDPDAVAPVAQVDVGRRRLDARRVGQGTRRAGDHGMDGVGERAVLEHDHGMADRACPVGRAADCVSGRGTGPGGVAQARRHGGRHDGVEHVILVVIGDRGRKDRAIARHRRRPVGDFGDIQPGRLGDRQVTDFVIVVLTAGGGAEADLEGVGQFALPRRGGQVVTVDEGLPAGAKVHLHRDAVVDHKHAHPAGIGAIYTVYGVGRNRNPGQIVKAAQKTA